MESDATGSVLTRLDDMEKRLAGVDRMTDEIDRLGEEVTRLRSANLELTARLRDQRGDDAAPTGDSDGLRRRGLSRSEFLRLGGAAAAAGAVAAGAGGMLGAGPAAADGTGQPLLIGGSNHPTTTADVTRLINPSFTQLTPNLMRVDNWTTVQLALPTARIGLASTASGDDAGGPPQRIGVLGHVVGPAGYGVVGRFGTSGPSTVDSDACGVLGVGQDDGIGVYGRAEGANGIAVRGFSQEGIGMDAGSSNNVALYLRGSGRLHQQVRSQPGSPPAAGFGYWAGEQIRDANGEMWLCVEQGNPGTWRRVATVREGFKGGSVNILPKPIRLYDSRTGGAPRVMAGATVDVQVIGVVVGGVSVPAGAVGVIGNVTVVSTVGPSGFLTLFPQGSPPSPVTASINWFGANQILNTAALVGLNTANGKIGIGNGLGGGSQATHVVFDASGFVF